MGSYSPLSAPVASRWPSGWQLAVDPATRAFLNVLRRINPASYWKARREAETQVEELVRDVVPDSDQRPADYEALLERLDLDETATDEEEAAS